ncbi:MAG TPA: hypothetical protein VFN40_01080 [Gemmatimonadales bacterium]|nr:hypothetical protein [Gemmatimonadales bacterium]
MTKRMAALAAAALAACSGSPSPAPSPVRAPARFQVLGNASPSDSGPPTLRIQGQQVVIRGVGIQVEGGGLYGDVDLSEPRTLRLTLYDSLPGRPVDDPPPSPVYRQVIYEAVIGPLAPGAYDVWVGRFDAEARMVEVAHEPLRIEVEAVSTP